MLVRRHCCLSRAEVSPTQSQLTCFSSNSVAIQVSQSRGYINVSRLCWLLWRRCAVISCANQYQALPLHFYFLWWGESLGTRLDPHPHFACCAHAHRSILSLCTGPDTTLYGCRVYSWHISRRMASRGKVVLSLGNTLFNIRAQCCKTKTRQKMIWLWRGEGGLFIFIPLGVQFVLKQNDKNKSPTSNKVTLIGGQQRRVCGYVGLLWYYKLLVQHIQRVHYGVYSNGLVFKCPPC